MKETLQQQKKTVPFQSVLSLRLLIDFWKRGLTNGTLPFGEPLLEELRKVPELADETVSMETAKKHSKLINHLMTAAIAPANGAKEVAAAIVPFTFESVFETPAFKRYVNFNDFADTRRVSIEGQDLTLIACMFILEEHYGVSTPAGKPLQLYVHNNTTGLEKVFHVSIDRQFCEIVPHGPVPSIDPNIIRFLIEKTEDRDLWLRYIRPQDFTFRGFLVFRMSDVTVHEMESSIKYELLQKNALSRPESFASLQQKLRSIFAIADLRLGLIHFDSDNNIVRNSEEHTCWEKVMDVDAGLCQLVGGSIYERVWLEKRYVVVPDLERYGFRTAVEEGMLESGIRGVLLAPLLDGDEPMGILELTAFDNHVINPLSGGMVERLLPMFAAALKRVRDELATEIRAVIQEKYTNIHPVVEWRFLQAGQRALDHQRRGEPNFIEDIVFRDVYPLFGMADVRNSSAQRAAAVRQDLLENFESAKKVLAHIRHLRRLPIIDEVLFNAEHHLRQITYGLGAGDEADAADFLQREVNPLLFHFGEEEDFHEDVEHYRQQLDPVYGVFYNRREQFEESLTRINKTISARLAEAQHTAQQMFPHYFEKYQTDGVEYTLYVGSSLTRDRDFDPFYLRNFRLWQLLLSIDIEKDIRRLKPSLKADLDVAQLILVHDRALSIRFRSDEKQFDVDGAYDIRYEIVKKRIDKAIVRDTGERLTQPGKLAVIYSQPKVAQEYQRYFQYLQAKGWLEDEVEDLELDELPGATGLRALRVTIPAEREAMPAMQQMVSALAIHH